MTINEIKIKIFLAKPRSETLAYVAIEFPVEIEGIANVIAISHFRIMTNHYDPKKNYRLLPPQIGPKFKDVFFLPNKELWFKLENRILNEYEKISAKEIYGQSPFGDTS